MNIEEGNGEQNDEQNDEKNGDKDIVENVERTVRKEILYRLFLFNAHSATIPRQMQVLVGLHHCEVDGRVNAVTLTGTSLQTWSGQSQGDIAVIPWLYFHGSSDFSLSLSARRFKKYVAAGLAPPVEDQISGQNVDRSTSRFRCSDFARFWRSWRR